MLEIVGIFILMVLAIFSAFIVGYLILVFVGLMNFYGEHDQLMNWLRSKIEIIKQKVSIEKNKEDFYFDAYRALFQNLQKVMHAERAKPQTYFVLNKESTLLPIYSKKFEILDTLLDELIEEIKVESHEKQFEIIISQISKNIKEEEVPAKHDQYLRKLLTKREFPVNEEYPILKGLYAYGC